MPMLCLAGAFHVLGTQPDGDSVRFRPDDPAAWDDVPGAHAVRRNAAGAAQLRVDAIDALETHYTPPGGHTLHQPLELAHAAAAELLSWLGFTGVQRDGETVSAVAADDRPGFILTRGADLYGRCVALVGRGRAGGAGRRGRRARRLWQAGRGRRRAAAGDREPPPDHRGAGLPDLLHEA